MKTLTIRGLPDEVHARLKERAKQNRRSLNQEVIAELAETEAERDATRQAKNKERVGQALKKVDEIRSQMTSFFTTEEIRAAINEGRR